MTAGLTLAILAGALVGLQNVFNHRVSERAGTWPTIALVLGFGFAASLALGWLAEGRRMFALPDMQPWYWFSGLIGVGVVLCLVQGIRWLGPTYAVSIALASQLGFALLFDAQGWLGLERIPLSPVKLLGAAVVVAGIIVFKAGETRRGQPAPGE